MAAGSRGQRLLRHRRRIAAQPGPVHEYPGLRSGRRGVRRSRCRSSGGRPGTPPPSLPTLDATGDRPRPWRPSGVERRHPGRVEQPGDRRQVPHHPRVTGPGRLSCERIVVVQLHQEVAERPAPGHVTLEVGQRHRQRVGGLIPGDVDQIDVIGEQSVRGVPVLQQVEAVVDVWAGTGVPGDEDDDQLLGDRGVEQQSRGDVGRRPEHGDVERFVGGVSELDDRVGSGSSNDVLRVVHEPVGAAVNHRSMLRPSGVEDADDLGVTALDPERWRSLGEQLIDHLGPEVGRQLFERRDRAVASHVLRSEQRRHEIAVAERGGVDRLRSAAARARAAPTPARTGRRSRWRHRCRSRRATANLDVGRAVCDPILRPFSTVCGSPSSTWCSGTC